MANYIAEKYQENDMNNKLIEGGVIVAKGLGEAGKALYKVSKPVVKFTTIKAIQGIGYLCNLALDVISDKETKDKEKIKDNEKIEQNIPNPNYQINSLDLPDGGQLVFQESKEYPTFESIDRIYKNNNNNNNIMQNNLNNNNININNIQNQNNMNDMNMIYNNQYNNNQIKRPDYSTARGLDYSIIGEI